MKTPYDSAMRVQQQQVDSARVAITRQISQIDTIDREKQSVVAAMQREIEIAMQQTGLPSEAYRARMRALHQRLKDERAEADARLVKLRSDATVVFGELRAIEGVADRYRNEEEMVAARTEQARADDFAAAAFIKATAGRRRNSG